MISGRSFAFDLPTDRVATPPRLEPGGKADAWMREEPPCGSGSRWLCPGRFCPVVARGPRPFSNRFYRKTLHTSRQVLLRASRGRRVGSVGTGHRRRHRPGVGSCLSQNRQRAQAIDLRSRAIVISSFLSRRALCVISVVREGPSSPANAGGVRGALAPRPNGIQFPASNQASRE